MVTRVQVQRINATIEQLAERLDKPLNTIAHELKRKPHLFTVEPGKDGIDRITLVKKP